MGLIHTGTVEDLVEAIEGNLPDLNMEGVIDMTQAVQALRSGAFLALIVEDTMAELETHLIRRVLMSTQGNKSEAARRLRIDYKTLYRKLQKYADV